MKHLPIEHLMRVFTIDAMDNKYVFGEVLTTNDNEEAIFLWPIIEHTQFPCYRPSRSTRRSAALSRPREHWRELVNPAAYGQALPWQRALTFSITHDIPCNATFRRHDARGQDEYLANAYIMAATGGVPLVYSDHNESADAYPGDRDRWAESWNRYGHRAG